MRMLRSKATQSGRRVLWGSLAWLSANCLPVYTPSHLDQGGHRAGTEGRAGAGICSISLGQRHPSCGCTGAGGHLLRLLLLPWPDLPPCPLAPTCPASLLLLPVSFHLLHFPPSLILWVSHLCPIPWVVPSPPVPRPQGKV